MPSSAAPDPAWDLATLPPTDWIALAHHFARDAVVWREMFSAALDAATEAQRKVDKLTYQLEEERAASARLVRQFAAEPEDA